MHSLQPLLLCSKLVDQQICRSVSPDNESFIEIRLGLALLERVPHSPENLAFRMLIGRLHNCGFAASALAEIFKVCRKSVARYAEAVRDGSSEALQRIAETRSAPQKITPEVARFARMRYQELKGKTRNYRAVILRQIKTIFELSISRESLRLICNDAPVHEPEAEARSDVEECQSKSLAECAADWPAAPARLEATTCHLASTPRVNAPSEDNPTPHSKAETPLEMMDNDAPGEESARAIGSPRLPLSGLPAPSQPTFLHHAGTALFWPFLDVVGAGLNHPLPRQWISQVLQGAVNIEQTRDLAKDHLGYLIGPVYGRSAQREGLAELACPEAVMAAYECNARLLPLGPQHGRYFYYDPHTKEYSGACKILKGWCGRRHSIGKVLHMDFIHTEQGHPCFSQCYDNYYDLRERFPLTVEQFEQLRLGADNPPMTWIVDRGIYGKDSMQKILDRGHHLITWEKGYKRDGWQHDHPVHGHRIQRSCNTRRSRKTWHFQMQEHRWSVLPHWRRIIVRASNPKGNTIEVSILCSDPAAALGKIIDLMFNRWLQENDFGMLDRYYGMQQITSYQRTAYSAIADTLRDREITTAEYKQRRKVRNQARRQLADLLLTERQTRSHIDTLSAEYDTLLAALRADQQWCQANAQALSGAANSRERDAYARILDKQAKRLKQAKKLKKQLQRLRRKHAKQTTRIAEAERLHQEAERALETAVRSASRLELLLAENYSRLDTGSKLLMDAFRVTARNIFAQLVAHFREFYDNLRDDHAILRLLTQASGWIHYDGRSLCIELAPRASFSKRQRTTIDLFLLSMSQQISRHFQDASPQVHISLHESGPIWEQI